MLGLVGLTDVMHKRIKSLSGGMRRRVIVAQALLNDPGVLVLDEPTVGLDPEQRLRFRELVSGVAETHPVLLSTHQTEDVAALCHRVVVIDAGRVLFDGTPEAMIEAARGRVWVSDQPDARARLSWRTGLGHHRLIGDPPPGATLAEPALEDAYLLLIGRAPDTRRLTGELTTMPIILILARSVSGGSCARCVADASRARRPSAARSAGRPGHVGGL